MSSENKDFSSGRVCVCKQDDRTFRSENAGNTILFLCFCKWKTYTSAGGRATKL